MPELYNRHRGQFLVSRWPDGKLSNLSREQRETVDGVLGFYGDKPAQWLSDLTHSEDPWKDARQGLEDGQRGNREITHAAMMEYYSSL